MQRSTEATLAVPSTSRSPRPFLKWAGGKGQLLEQFARLLPEPRRYSRYFEPFVGSAALFFDLQPASAELTDVNSELIDCYKAVRDRVEDVIDALAEHQYREDHYYRVRDIPPASLPLAERAARMIFLNKTGFNGLYRVNKSGRFNVPFGRYVKPGFKQPRSLENLRACSRALQDVVIEVNDFESVLHRANTGDFVYFDPPYVPLSDTSDFTAYVPGGFGPDKQRHLAEVFRKLAERDVLVMLSNSDSGDVRRLYSNFHIHEVQAARHINAKADKRGKIAELVVTSF
jgi:DNA adenine methylase